MRHVVGTLVAFCVILVFVGCGTMRTAPMDEQQGNAALAGKVKSALAEDKMMDLSMVKVDARDDTIYLSGTVQTGAQRARAASVASRVEGVKSVVNNLRISKS